jgi:hypothetical protein
VQDAHVVAVAQLRPVRNGRSGLTWQRDVLHGHGQTSWGRDGLSTSLWSTTAIRTPATSLGSLTPVRIARGCSRRRTTRAGRPLWLPGPGVRPRGASYCFNRIGVGALDGVGHEPPLDRRGRRAVDVVAGQQVADDLTRPRDLAAAMAGPARVRQGEVELGERTGQVRGEARLIAVLVRPDRSTDIGPGVDAPASVRFQRSAVRSVEVTAPPPDRQSDGCADPGVLHRSCGSPPGRRLIGVELRNPGAKVGRVELMPQSRLAGATSRGAPRGRCACCRSTARVRAPRPRRP